MVEMIKKNKEIFVICILYGIISLMFFYLILRGNAVMYPDSTSYIQPAKYLLSRFFFTSDGIHAEYVRTPGYSLFLALIYRFGGNNNTIVILQIILGTIMVYLFYQVLIMMHTPKKLSLLGSILLLCNISSFGLFFVILTEPLFSFFLMLSLYFLVKYINDGRNLMFFLAFSISINYALFVRPILMYFNILICLALLIVFIIRKVQFKCFVLFILCFFLVFGGWSCRNYIHSGVFIFSTVQKNNMQMFYAPIITAGSDYMKNHEVRAPIEGVTDYHNEMFLKEYPEAGDGSLNEAQISILRGKYGSQFIRTHFLEYIKVNLIGFYQMMFSSFQTKKLFEATTSGKIIFLITMVQLLYLFYILIVYIVYLIGLVFGFKRPNIIQIIIFLLCGYLAVSGAIFGTVRFRDPFFPLLLLSAVSNSGIIIQWLSQRLHIPVLQRIEKYLLHESDSGSNNL